ncbi:MULTISPECIES: TetR/AcrR family transcriptional regulator [unclassified Nocardia]|uniref:TetR/AcrR family transcriptional regulator n=1 Tax=unclassified Nocardia TaxID=2637762 RepID=UPI001CE476B4|nr:MULTISPECIES: TetR/AcrR family transcriptional regulator [unclassified Nocardia]
MDAPSTARPMRADARRNYERIVEAARAAFAEHGPDAPLDDIARRAGVGAGTLYRHFPNRDALIEAVYRSSIERLSSYAHELAATHPPETALEMWLQRQVRWVLEERSLAVTLKALIDRESETFELCRVLMNDAATAILKPAQTAGLVRGDIEPRDLLRFGHGIAIACETAPEAADRLLAVTMDGLRTTGARPADG